MITIRLRSILWFATGACMSVAMLVLFAALRADAAPTPGESTFVPIEPCRLFDFRAGPDNVGPKSTPLGPGVPYTQQVTGTNGNCTIPTTATAVAMNVTITNPTAVSYLTLSPAGVATPTASNLNWVANQAPTPNKVDVKLSPSGAVDIFNNVGTVNVLGDVVGYYASSTVVDLEQRLAALETKLASVSIVTVDAQPTVRFTGVNVQVVDGSGTTSGATNGRGNLIVGYNENISSRVRTGSHNLVVGPEHGYESGAGVTFGVGNRTTAFAATVTGGFSNLASGTQASVSGGSANTASGEAASVTAGSINHASGPRASITGGAGNNASAESASVSGGTSNAAFGPRSSISGGAGNGASGVTASVAGGSGNRASGVAASILGGNDNQASQTDSVVVGGASNRALAVEAVAVGGDTNDATGQRSTTVGGFGNSAGQNDVSLGGDNRDCDVDADAGICAEAEIWTG